MSLEQALINSGNASNTNDAKELIADMMERVYEGENPEEILYEYGLEPDYIFDILEA
jgi:hypothetical protein